MYSLRLVPRTMMLAARAALEDDMYQWDEVPGQMPDVERRKDNVKLLCSVFVLNRHTYLAASPPYCLTDSDVDFPCQYVFLIPVRSYTDSSIGVLST